MYPKLTVVALMGLCSVALSAADAGPPLAQANFYVAPAGDDTSQGTFADPFATIERAQEAVRLLVAEGLVAEVRVCLRGGVYALDHTLELGPQDSGTADHGVTYMRYPGEEVRVMGATELQAEWFTPVAASSPVWGRIDPLARGHLMQIDLPAHGISEFGVLNKRGFWNQGGPSGLEVFFNQEPMQLGRWPDKVPYSEADGNVLSSTGWVVTERGLDKTRFTYTGTRPERWSRAEEVWVHGLFKNGWADTHLQVTDIDTAAKVMTLASEPYYGLAGDRPYYAENLLEEITVPGEWYLNRATGILYFWPPSPLPQGEIYVSYFAGNSENWADPLVHLNNASHVTFDGIVFEMTRAGLVRIEGGTDNQLANCVLRNAGMHAALISGSNNGLDRCEISGVGNYGVELNGGDVVSLAPANNYVRNCHIHHYARWCWTVTPAVRLMGVGQVAEHNHIHHSPHEGIMFRGNDHRIEFNDIHDVCQWVDDAAAIGSPGRDWRHRGTRIRYNFVHDVGSKLPRRGFGTHGIYLDCTLSGSEVFGNVLYDIAGFAVFLNGGRDNLIENNIFVKCAGALAASACGISVLKPDTDLDLVKQLASINYRRPPYSTSYPKLAVVPDNWAELQDPASNWLYPEGSTFSRNMGWQNGIWAKEINWGFGGTGALTKFKIENNVEDADPCFTDEPALDLSLDPTSPALAIPGFQPIPFDEIGITPEPGNADTPDRLGRAFCPSSSSRPVAFARLILSE